MQMIVAACELWRPSAVTTAGHYLLFTMVSNAVACLQVGGAFSEGASAEEKLAKDQPKVSSTDELKKAGFKFASKV